MIYGEIERERQEKERHVERKKNDAMEKEYRMIYGEI